MSIRFLHVADIHLDGFIKGQELIESTTITEYIRTSIMRSFEKAVQYAINEKLDFIIVAGDFFHGSYRSVATYQKIITLFEKLEKKQIPIFIIYGNHDFIGSQPVNFPFPSSVKIFKDEIEIVRFEKEGFPPVSLVGFSYPHRHVTENMVMHFPVASPNEITIGLLHGSSTQSSEHDMYAPFKVEELLEKKYDYWALGHIHKREIVHTNPFIIYPGNIQGRHKKETGEKGGFVVEIDERKNVTTNFVRFSDLQWSQDKWDASNVKNIKEMLEFLRNKKDELRLTQGNLMLSLTISVNSSSLSIDELNECIVVTNELEFMTPFILIADVSFEIFQEEEWENLQKSLPFFQSLQESIDNTDVLELAAPFLKHSFLYDEIEEMLDEKQEEWKRSAKQKLITGLFSQK